MAHCQVKRLEGEMMKSTIALIAAAVIIWIAGYAYIKYLEKNFPDDGPVTVLDTERGAPDRKPSCPLLGGAL
jgi:hypothetical protein